MAKEEVKIELLSSGYKINWPNGNVGILRLHWGLRSNDWVNKGDSSNERFMFFFKWQLEFEHLDTHEHEHYFEEVELPIGKYSGKESFQMLLVDALKKIFVRVGRKDGGFVAFLLKHFDVFFDRLEQKLTDTKLNIELVTDIFEQALLLTQSDLLKVKKEYPYPEKKEEK